jgi:hypothetical protein
LLISTGDKQAIGVCKRLSSGSWGPVRCRWKGSIVGCRNWLMVCVLHSFSSILLGSDKPTIAYGIRVQRVRSMRRMGDPIFRYNIIHA